jgi:hypothetical protein
MTFENKTEPLNEVQIADALRLARKDQGDLSDEDWKGYLAEHSAFFFMERPKEDSLWKTYFAPMFTGMREGGAEEHSPDIKDLDADTAAHWENRAKSVANPVMRARYADLVWDLQKPITKGKRRRQHQYALIAIDAYLEATEKRLYTMDIEAVGWLRRALDLSLKLKDAERTKRVVDSMLTFNERVAEPRHVGVWIFPFDFLYGRKGVVTPEQEARIVADLEAMLARTSGAGKQEEFDPFGAEAAADRLARHYKRQGDQANVERVIKAYGQAFVRLAKEANPMLATAWLQPVIERYEQEGLKADAEHVQIMYTEKGKNMASDMKQIEVKVEIKPEEVDKLVEHLIGGGDLKTALLRVAEYFIPKADTARGLLERLRTDAPLMSMIPISVIERDGHTSAKIMDEDTEGRLHKQLGETIGFYQPFLVHTLEQLRARYAPTVEDLLGFLCESPLFTASRDGLLKDGLLAYEQEDFVKAIHVLVPQIEQILREFLEKLGIPPLKLVRNHPGIMDAKSMNDILAEERMRAALTENLWRYLAVVYIDKKGGLNLRNDLAHGLIPRKGFNRHIADRVFHTLLALSLMRAKK